MHCADQCCCLEGHGLAVAGPATRDKGKVGEGVLREYTSSRTRCLLVIKGLKGCSKEWMSSSQLYSSTSKASALPLRQSTVYFSI